MLLSLNNLSKEYTIEKKKSFNALSSVNLNFEKGELVSILGPSGCGKSTLLNIIAGLDRPTSGDLIIEGKSTKKYKKKNWDLYRKNNIGFIFQSFNLIEHLSALENVEIVMNLIGLSKKDRIKRAESLLKQVGLEKHMDHKPGELSGGQKQRVAIARALANDPDIILADEPTGALDKKTGIQIMQLIKDVARDKLIIMVTHNRELAYEYSTRVVAILDGKIQKDEKINESEKNSLKSELKKKDGSMSFGNAIKLSLRNIKEKMGRIVVTTIAGSIGIAGILLVIGLSNGATNYIDIQTNSFASANIIQASMKFKDAAIEKTDYPKNINVYDSIKKNPDVLNVREDLNVKDITSFEANNKELKDIPFNSLAGENYLTNIEHALKGSVPKDNKNELLVNKDMAKNVIEMYGMNPDKDDYTKAIGKKLKVIIQEKTTNPITGDEILGKKYTQDFKVVGVVDEIALSSASAYYSYDAVNTWLKNDGYFIGKENRIVNAEVVIKDVHNNEAVLNYINAKENGGIGGNKMTETKGFSATSQIVMVKTAIKTLINLAEAVMIVFISLALVVSTILIGIVIFSSVLERKKEIGILKAVGARNKDIARIFQAESALIGLFAGVTGVLVAFIIQPIANRIINNVLNINADNIVNIPLTGIPFTDIKIPFVTIAGLIVISILVAVLAGHFPSKRATKIQVIDALRDE
ncbi:ATP-binding cassette domain-containing protein [Clostridium sp. CM027]|uniref:ABC transporter ATP-binding protein/permease n=1 Tax=Clostridium sp. CM027 TaxID=2849865 RepID=UPI001C6EA8B0|nr:ABC transporter ATP-binding protein/permease [Clostridium sp. CM027]MBW9146475.1 ATP-binding cassette domain-containing protein [Clostridium sp. CM027]UVE41975.1 ATP-binding cassette domain-containing protein [Clostridium sp. CM027]